MNGTLAEPTSATKAMQNAIDRSRKLDPNLTRTTRVRSGVYRVEGESGDYMVTVDRLGYHCQCKAAQNGLKCWHAASCYRVRLAERAMRAAVAPAGTAARVVSTAARDSIWGQGSTL